jgi:HlyD family secretion protein
MKIADTSGQDVVLNHKNKNKPWIYGVVVIALLTLLGVFITPVVSKWSQSDASVSAERIRTGIVKRKDFVRDISVQGKVVAAVSPRLYSTAQGTITFQVDAGAQVNEGQILATIDSPELTNQLQQEHSSLQQLELALDRMKIQSKKQALENQKTVDLAKVSLNAADREKRRADKAFASKSISQIDFEKAQDDLENAQLLHQHAVSDAQLNLESLAFEVSTAKLQVERQELLVQELTRKVDELNLRSPVNGIVGNLAVQQKNQVSPNQAILSIVDLSEFELELQIPESYADDLAIGMQAQVNLNGDTHLATLVTISPEIQNNQVTGRVRFPEESPAGLRQNQRLTTRILLESKLDALTVQRGQFLQSSNGRFVYKIEDGVAIRTSIKIGARSISEVEIIEGLKAGDEIIVSNTDTFNHAQNVLITQ